MAILTSQTNLVIRKVCLPNMDVHIETQDSKTWIDERTSLDLVKQILGVSTFIHGDDWNHLFEEDKNAVKELVAEFHSERNPITRQHPKYKG
jgi:hypothetical protein